MKVNGGCHCGSVRFEAFVEDIPELQACNCSICAMSGYIHLIVPKENFFLLSDAENITTYSFNTHVAQHTFCKNCGIKSFYTPRSNPNGISINYRCLDREINGVTIDSFDGQNWEANADQVSHLSD